MINILLFIMLFSFAIAFSAFSIVLFKEMIEEEDFEGKLLLGALLTIIGGSTIFLYIATSYMVYQLISTLSTL